MTIWTPNWPNPLGLRVVRGYEEWQEARWPTIRARSWDEVHVLRERATTPPAPQREFLLPLRGGRAGVAGYSAIKQGSVGPSFDEETWAKAKLLFIQVAKEFGVAASDVNQLMRLLIKDLHVNYKMTEQAIKEMRVYLMRFVSEVRAGTISLEEEIS